MSAWELADFAAHLATIAADVEAAKEVAVVRGCKLIQRKAKGMLGHPQPTWPGLQPETIARKAHGDTPLLETGEMRESIEMTAPVHEGEAVVGYVGSNDPKARWHELGTTRIPPRPFLSAAAIGQERRIVEMTEQLVHRAMISGGPNYHTARLIIEGFKTLYDAASDILDTEDER